MKNPTAKSRFFAVQSSRLNVLIRRFPRELLEKGMEMRDADAGNIG